MVDQTLIQLGVHELLAGATTENNQFGFMGEYLLKVARGEGGRLVAGPGLVFTLCANEDAVPDLHTIYLNPVDLGGLYGLLG